MEERKQYTMGWDIDERMMYVPRKKKEKKPDQKRAWYYLGFVGDIGFAIALPIAGGAIIGVQIDKFMLTYPKATLTLLTIGIVIAGMGFVQIIKEVSKKNQ